MTTKRKRDRFKEWVLSFFRPKDASIPKHNDPKSHSASGGFFNNAEGFVINDPIMVSVQVDNTTVMHMQETVIQIMSLLSQNIIRGAAHDSSARTPPPRCHPDTRVKLIARITDWFNGQARHELLLWITGPAGVGKSAIVQTFAEYLEKYHLLGASVFISRPNKRNNPHGIFITIAYQLATRIEEYRNFVVGRLSLDPELLSRDMRAQFMTFIVEPFVQKKIGAGGQRWGILLDGLDELRGEDAQCEIIELISDFVHKHHDTPLVWIIASRPESHISNTFEDEGVRGSYWMEYIPIDSTEACEDVERFLRSGFKTMQKKFRHSVPRDWPSDTDFLKLTAAASGLFVYAQVVMQFIGDSNHADPVSRFEVLLSVIDRYPTKENPFVHLDALYTEILSSIPSTQWPAAKRLLAFTIHWEQIHPRMKRYSPEGINYGGSPNFPTIRGMSILFDIPRHVTYACLNKCRSTLKIPSLKVAHKQTLTFFHASFSDYLKDQSRSGNFHVGNLEDVEAAVAWSLLEIWNKCSADDIAPASVESTWRQYCSRWGDKTPSRAIAKFHRKLFRDMVDYVGQIVCGIPRVPAGHLTYAQLCKIHMIKLSYYFNTYGLLYFVHGLASAPLFTGFIRIVQLRELKLGHLDWKDMSSALVHPGKIGKLSIQAPLMLHRPRSSAQLKSFISELESLQENSPEIKVFICGVLSEGRIAAFRCPFKLPEDTSGSGSEHFMYYVIPYPV